MGKIWDFIKTTYEWCINNTDKLVLIAVVVICIILAPCIIGIVKSLVRGMWSILKFIYSVIAFPFRTINKVSNYLNNRKPKIGVNNYTVTA